MKKVILIDASGSNTSSWIGGLYYRKNILFSLLQNPNIINQYKIIVVTDKTNENVFKSISDEITVLSISSKKYKITRIQLLAICIKYQVKYIFPTNLTRWFRAFGVVPITWIADFQHNHLPEFFTNEIILQRTNNYMKVANENNPLILSSEDSKKDFLEFYNSNRKNVYVVPFVSYIENEIQSLTDTSEKSIIRKHKLENCRYVCVCNQFWKHKNHIVLFHAIEKLLEIAPENELIFVCTGAMEDFRDPKYINTLKGLITKIEDKIKILGFIDRTEQIAIMKNASFIIQPSLFEGWGTVLEDAKVLDKRVLLSDILIHREQRNDNCVMFNPYDSSELAQLILKLDNTSFESNIENGISKMYFNALKYSAEFEQLLENN